MQGHIRKRHRATCAKKVERQKKCNCDGPHQARFRDPDDPRKWHEKSFALKRDAEDWLQSHQGAQLRNDWISPRQGDRLFSEIVEARVEGVMEWPPLAADDPPLRVDPRHLPDG